ncbi:MAG: hypothetical protein GY847_32250 [Proteobacteria bacterium]|nr:hypothetical protein [Pseudomonadota bacterium]
MNQKGTSIEDENVFAGTGEFQFRDTYVVASVEVKDGIVQKIEFTSKSGIQIQNAEQISGRLRGKPLSVALEVKAQEIGTFEDHRGENVADVALLEAFHRAVEACLDNE